MHSQTFCYWEKQQSADSRAGASSFLLVRPRWAEIVDPGNYCLLKQAVLLLLCTL